MGIQTEALRSNWRTSLGPDQALQLIHAFNIYDFSWDRRVTEEGCDLHRSFVYFRRGPPVNSGYNDIRDFLVPEQLGAPEIAHTESGIAAYRGRHGQRAFQLALKGGQYVDPMGCSLEVSAHHPRASDWKRSANIIGSISARS